MRWERESELALRAVSTAQDLLEGPERGAVTVKGAARDVVTDLDRRVERHVADVLRPSGHPVFGEEGWGEAPAGARSPLPGAGPYWLVDPIDGTANFLTGMPYYSVSAGLCDGPAFVAGAVALPALKELFFTHGDQGAYLNGRALRVADARLDEALVAAAFSGAVGDPDQRAAEYALFGEVNDASRGCLRLGSSAVNVCYVAAGRLQAAYGVRAAVWDVAAALAIALQAGCRVHVARHAGGDRVDFAVGAPSVVEDLLGRLARHGFETAPSRVAARRA